MKTILKWIFGILGGLIIFVAISSYLPSNTETLRDTPEQSAKDAEKPISNIGVFDCLTGEDGVITPNEEYLYSLNKMTVFESHPDGVLICVAQDYENFKLLFTDVAFLITDRNFADGAMLNGYLAAFKGTYEYPTTDNRIKKVLAFKLITRRNITATNSRDKSIPGTH